MNYLPIIIFVLVIVALIAFAARARRRQAHDQAAREDRIVVGTEVMTTSGLHGTVVAVHEDGSVKLSIAPGVEVTWELAALRDRASLPPQYAREPAVDRDADDADNGPHRGVAEPSADALGPSDQVRLDKRPHADEG